MKDIILLLLISFMPYKLYAQNDFLLLNRNRPLIEVFVNGKKSAMLIDTGSSMNIICTEKLQRYGIDSKAVKRSVNTVNGQSEVYLVSNINISCKNKSVDNFYSVNISNSCTSIERETGVEVIGILGTPAIRQLRMVIDVYRGIVTINKNDVAQADN